MASTDASPARKDAETLYAILSHVKRGTLVVREPDGTRRTFGEENSDLSAEIAIHDWAMFTRILADGTLGAGETYMDGMWDVTDNKLMECLGIILMNDIDDVVGQQWVSLVKTGLARLLTRPWSALRSRANVHHHYDVGNAFFRLMLDPSMAYSCGILDDQYPVTADKNSLANMQWRKHELVCKKLGLQKDERLVDIGCGWGEMICYAARAYGVKAVGITLSDEQYAWAKQRVENEGLSDRVEVKKMDYRDLTGEFDAFVSIGMFEHVGDENYGTFMRKANELLRPGGRGLLHTIGDIVPGAGYDPWMQKYIFPGGHLPSLDRIIIEMENAGFTIGHVENFKVHYAETLRHWKENVDAHKEQIAFLGPPHDERWFRMWDYYLQSCEAGFRYGKLALYQTLFSKGHDWVLPMRFRF